MPQPPEARRKVSQTEEQWAARVKTARKWRDAVLADPNRLVGLRARERRARLKRLGYTPELVEELLFLQGNRCAICEEPFKPKEGKRGGSRADHDHSTGRPRGLLCVRCNVALGQFKDNELGLMKAVEYVRNPPIGRTSYGK